MCKMKSSRSSSPVINNQIKQEVDDDDEESLKPLAAWKSRTKIRKPKFLSLSSKIIPQIHARNKRPPPKSSSAAATATAASLKSTKPEKMTSATRQQHKQQLNLFPLHPENPVDQQDDNVALFFQSDGGATLNGLLTSPETTTTTTTTTMSSDLEEESFSPYAHYREKQGNIVRTAMRSRERDAAAAEKWVCYSDLVAEMKEEAAEDCSTSTANTAAYSNWEEGGVQLDEQWRSRGLALKLDYQEILDAWSDKGPLCIDGGDSPQTVPDLMLMQDDQLFQPHDHTPNGSAGNSWTVPEGGDDSTKTKTAEQREASVMRYKEKRQNRLFAKRIRYEVRKLNAEKRPRIKGRFVKRST